MRSLIIAAALMLPAVSQAKTLEDLLVEKGVITKAEAASTASSPSRSKVFWNDGTRFEFPDNGFSAGFATFLLERYTFTDADEDAGRRNASSFEQRKARIILFGTALNNEFTYYLSTDFVGEKNDDGENVPGLKDAYVQWNACDWANVRMGQYKTFISKQWNVADHKLQFPDRTVASDYFNLDRQQGASAALWSEDKSVQLRAGIFNGNSTGEGINRPGNDTDVAGMAAVRYNPLGDFDIGDETDINYSENLGLSFGAAYAYTSNTTAEGDVDDQRISVDAAAKVEGFAASAELFYRRSDAGDSQEPLGFYAQGGYFVLPKELEVAARYGYVDCDNGSAPGICSGLDKLSEVGAAVNYYWWKHFLQASLGYTFVNEDTIANEDYNTSKWMFQLSSYF